MKTFSSRLLNIQRNFCSAANEEILVSIQKSVATVTLNIPKTLNSLNLNMINLLRTHVQRFNEDPQIRAVIFKGAGPKAFCAGGDVKSIHNSIKENRLHDASDFFTNEFRCDYEIATMKPVQIALFNGIVMGGGVGISIHAPIKIACENSVFAMPESKIGFFTDVGASYFLPRLRNSIGYYLGLTSRKLKGKELVTAGIATHFVPYSAFEELEKILCTSVSVNSTKNDILKLLEKYSQEVPLCLENEEKISHFFSASTFEEFFKRIANSEDEFCKSIVPDLLSGSPLSLHIIFELLKKGEKLSLKECLQMDSHICQNLEQNSFDFLEGVRALLIEKDNKPDWKFKDPLAIPREVVLQFFKENGKILF